MTTSAIEQRRARRRRRRRRIIVWTTSIGIIAMFAAIGTVSAAIVTALADSDTAATPTESAPTPTPARELIEFPRDEPAATAGAEPCTTVPVLSSFENADMVASLAAAYSAQPRNVGGLCVTVTSGKEKSGDAADAVIRGFAAMNDDDKPSVWIPDASTWVNVARTGGAQAVRTDGTSIASSDIVLAMPRALAEAIGWDEDPPTWDEVFDAAGDDTLWTDLGHPEWGTFKLGKTSPLAATSGEAAIFASFGAAAGSLESISTAVVTNADVLDEVRAHELSVSHYMATPEHFLWHARQAEEKGTSADFLSAVIVDEKSVWDYNRGITSRDGITRSAGDPPQEPLVAIYPADGTYGADNPAMRLSGEWIDPVEAEAAADFLRYLRTAEGQEIVRKSGYRDLNGELDSTVADVANLATHSSATLPLPTAQTVSAIHAAFADVRKRANVLFLLDVSGSMDEPIAGGYTKLSAAKHAIELALSHFTRGDNVGIAAFAQDGSGRLVPGLLSPVADIASSRDEFLSALRGIQSMGDTPLYEAVNTFAQQQASSWSSDRINAIVLLSDGENDVNTPTTTVEEMKATLEHLHHGTPVLVFTLAYGADADVAALQAISSATGAHYYDATDPNRVASVLGDLVTSF